MSEIRFYQTSDYLEYLPLLRLTEKSCIKFCQINSIPYFQTVGFYRGISPWHATFNRITYFYELMRAGFTGWSIYCDADAYVNDLSFPIREFTNANSDKSLIVASGLHEHVWAVNAGVLLLNLGNKLGQKLVELWYAKFCDTTGGGVLEDPATAWTEAFNDQQMLHEILGHNDDILSACLVDDGSLLNYRSGRFIRQVLRSDFGTMPERLAWVVAENQRILEPEVGASLPPGSGAALAEGFQHVVDPIGGKPLRPRPQSLTDLANKYHSDKGTVHPDAAHRYTYLYDLLFAPVRDDAIDFLEIGLAAGGPEIGGPIDRVVASPSVQMWLEYFSKARIFGFDISDFGQMVSERFCFVRGDAGVAADLSRLADATLVFDIIIDDASHASYHQQLAFKVLFPKLAYGGLYIIEDLHWQSPYYEDKLPAVPKTADFFNGFFLHNEYMANDLFSAADMEAIKNSLASFAPFPSFDGSYPGTKMIVMRKHAD